MESGDATAVHVRVTGRVQGVAFRWEARRRAEELGVVGWVRNEADGSVTSHVEGPADLVDDMVGWLRRGPPSAKVRDCAVRDATVTGSRSFEITG